MAVAKMKLVSIIGHMQNLDAVVRVCGSCGVFQPDDALTFFSDTSGFAAIKEDNPYADPLSRLEAAAGRAGGTLALTDLPETLSDQELADYVQDFSSTVAELSRQRTDSRGQTGVTLQRPRTVRALQGAGYRARGHPLLQNHQGAVRPPAEGEL